MKCRNLLILLLLLVLTAGCTTAPVETEPPTQPVTVPTDPPTEPPTDHSLPEAVGFYQDLLDWHEEQRYFQALGCVFETPERLPVYFFFYNGVGHPGSWGDVAEAERTALLQAGLTDEMDLQIMPAQKLEAALRQYFGVDLAEVEIPAEWVYSPDSDCYYSNHNDAWVTSAQVTEVRETAEGLIRVFYTADFVFYNPTGEFDLDTGEYLSDAAMVLTLRPVEDGYQMISNVFAE